MCSFKRLQERFRLRLADARMVRLHTVILPRNRAQLAAWAEEEAEVKKWQALCHSQTCPDCGGFFRAAHEDDTNQTPLCCRHPARINFLARELRRLAGINPGPQPTRISRGEWADALKGKDGPRGCGPMSWDNAVKCWEEG